MANKNRDQFSFNISLSVLNHLGRNLYRSFVTVLGEAISNSWDADAKNVWIYIDKKNNNFVIKDDGVGMSAIDFQNKFLKIGYSKRKDGITVSPTGRPFIGNKGIGKLALLSCAERITVISRTKITDYIGGIIDNSGLDKAITNDLSPQEYILGNYREKPILKHLMNHRQGTIIYFENIKGGIKNSLGLLRKVIALYFRFSLIDTSFNIFVDGKKVTHKDLKELAEQTQLLWRINDINDPYLDKELGSPEKSENLKRSKNLKVEYKMKGFIASVVKPRDLNILNTKERVSIDLFVNGRLRETNILKHIPTARVVEEYLYGQIHFDELDKDAIDRFTSSREAVVNDDKKYQDLLKTFREKVLKVVLEDWDIWRSEIREDGDPDNLRITKTQRKSIELYNAVSKEYIQPKKSGKKNKVNTWIDELIDDAGYNFSSYAECFISENLIRKYIKEKKIMLTKQAIAESDKWKKREVESKGRGNISIEVRRIKSDLSYLSMDDLAALVDKKDPNIEACLLRDANEYKPIRDALAHTALLTDIAKKKLTSIYENIKGRVKTLLS